MVYYMKMTFEIPAALALRFKASVPKGRRSVMVSRLLEGEIKSTEADLEAACERANALNLDTKDGENLNDPKRGEIWWVNLDPTQGREIKKHRLCVIVSADWLNLK